MSRHFNTLHEQQAYLRNGEFDSRDPVFKHMRGSRVTFNPMYPDDDLVYKFTHGRRIRRVEKEVRMASRRRFVKPSQQRHEAELEGEKNWRKTERRLRHEGKLATKRKRKTK